ncbi:RidA family protein [Sphingobium subterraneum]|uniref:Enamine deaminase RidA (YjgF/YER057c/UK114 family) n=1 Tax=Sphingobium subterraneum TaxID=627688 RepID=A0A841J5W8_9SPHN|nr:RidA family protein [Sphingobium subterraneum]MBB6123611.1 enamine deaminase RidA (YjgF/YER057c/UK114 family) [Sphingobium subterraneum]
MTTDITRMNPSTLPDAGAAGYSQISIVEPSKLAFISGQVAWSVDGKPTPSTLGEQAEMVIQNCRSALQAVGATAKDIVIARVYMTDLTEERLGELFPYVHALFDGNQPSLTGIGVAALAGPDLQLEIEMTVRIPG